MFFLSLLVVAGWATYGCVSTDLPDDADYRHRYFAVLADYNQAKRAALAYVQIPATPVEHIDAILSVINRADQRIRQFEATRRVSELLEAEYTSITSLVTIAADQLRSYAAREPS
jgi:hypothetical protein